MSAEAKVISHFNGNGSFAHAYFQGNGGRDYSLLYVTQGGTNQAPTTYFSYYAATCDSAGMICSGIQGSGTIPNKDFTASGRSASLFTNTAENTGFYAVAWTWNFATGEYTESPISMGTVAVNWASSGIASTKTIGTSTKNWLNTTWKSTGQSSWSDATASGTMGGAPLDLTTGEIGTNSTNDIYIERN